MLIIPSQPHVLADFYGCDPARLNDFSGIESLLVRAAAALGTAVVGRVFHQFSPHGVTGILAITESHLSVHTWVEHGHAALDLFLCNSKPVAEVVDAVIADMAAFFCASSKTVSIIQRGLGVPAESR